MAVALCVRLFLYVSTGKITVTVWVMFCVFLCHFSFLSPPCKWHAWLVCVFLCISYKLFCIYVVCLNIFSNSGVVSCPFVQVGHPSLSLFRSPHPNALSALLTPVGNVITFRGWTRAKMGSLVEGKERANERVWTQGMWGRGSNSLWYVYPITTQASPKSPSRRMNARALKIATSIPPPPHVRWLQWWWGRLNNIMAFLSSVRTGLIISVSFCVCVRHRVIVCVFCLIALADWVLA